MPSLNRQILIAACLGLALGWLLSILPEGSETASAVLYASTLVSSAFLGLLRMILIPLIFTSIVVGVANLQAHHQVHRVWVITLCYFVITVSLAMLVALLAANWFEPGAGLSLQLFAEAMADFEARQLTLPEFFQHFFANLFQNPFTAFSTNNILSVVVFALFIGIALVAGGERFSAIGELMRQMLDMLLLITGWIMRLAPLGILALLLRLVAEQDAALLLTVLGFIVLVFATTLFHGVVVLPGVLYLATRRSPMMVQLHCSGPTGKVSRMRPGMWVSGWPWCANHTRSRGFSACSAARWSTTTLPIRSPSTLTAVRMVSSTLSIGSRMAIASAGRPTACSTMTMVTIPELGMPGAPVEAIMAVKNTTICCPKLSSIPTRLATKSAAAASYRAVPSIFMVAPSGRTKPATP
jgi:hypothetical protein